jgi:hypothetical protein
MVRAPPVATPGVAGGGGPAQGPSGVDTGVDGGAWQTAWPPPEGAAVICPPKRPRTRPWPKRRRHGLAGRRPRGETVDDKRYQPFRRDRERPPGRGGVPARWAATVTRQHFCCWLTGQLDRPQLAVAAVMAW